MPKIKFPAEFVLFTEAEVTLLRQLMFGKGQHGLKCI